MRRIWTGVLVREVLPSVAYTYARCGDLDEWWHSEDSDRSVELAQILSGVLGTPAVDSQLVAVTRRDSVPAPWFGLWSLAVQPGGRIGVVVPRGVVESAGDHLGVIESPRQDRYAEFWCLPGVSYVGVRGA